MDPTVILYDLNRPIIPPKPWPAQPFAFGYEVRDHQGNEQYRKESSDGHRVTGSYGYWGPDNIYRHVDYIADENGYRANIRTSEPGTSNENPASVRITSSPVGSVPLPPGSRGPLPTTSPGYRSSFPGTTSISSVPPSTGYPTLPSAGYPSSRLPSGSKSSAAGSGMGRNLGGTVGSDGRRQFFGSPKPNYATGRKTIRPTIEQQHMTDFKRRSDLPESVNTKTTTPEPRTSDRESKSTLNPSRKGESITTSTPGSFAARRSDTNGEDEKLFTGLKEDQVRNAARSQHEAPVKVFVTNGPMVSSSKATTEEIASREKDVQSKAELYQEAKKDDEKNKYADGHRQLAQRLTRVTDYTYKDGLYEVPAPRLGHRASSNLFHKVPQDDSRDVKLPSFNKATVPSLAYSQAIKESIKQTASWNQATGSTSSPSTTLSPSNEHYSSSVTTAHSDPLKPYVTFDDDTAVLEGAKKQYQQHQSSVYYHPLPYMSHNLPPSKPIDDLKATYLRAFNGYTKSLHRQSNQKVFEFESKKLTTLAPKGENKRTVEETTAPSREKQVNNDQIEREDIRRSATGFSLRLGPVTTTEMPSTTSFTNDVTDTTLSILSFPEATTEPMSDGLFDRKYESEVKSEEAGRSGSNESRGSEDYGLDDWVPYYEHNSEVNHDEIPIESENQSWST
ncbi:Cuticle protein 10.9 [Halotydeus destructor]|nr:Cuticle protein 10.9 [Halotydeus destructor]